MWVSRGAGVAKGRVVLAADLSAIQEQELKEPVIVVADHVTGDEALPPFVSAVLTRESVDLVSHAAVRARNSGLVIVTVDDEARYAKLRDCSGMTVGLRVTATDEVIRDDEVAPVPKPVLRAVEVPKPAPFHSFAMPLWALDPTCAGGKSNRLRKLRRLLPDWIRTPRSMVIPFAVFDFVLHHPSNRALREHHERALALLADAGEPRLLAAARQVREGIVALAQPEGMREALRREANACSLSFSQNDFSVWHCITEVWASKFSDRAVLHRRMHGMSDEDVHMAVLVQEVASAPYSFVLHTVHPTACDPRRGYGEVVVGLGQTLVGNHPGWPLRFAWEKDSNQILLTSMPSKRVALYGGGGHLSLRRQW